MPSATRKPPKRTRRVSQPFDARLEVRLYSTELAKLRDEAKARNLSASDLVRFQLGSLIDAAPPAPVQPAGQEPEGAQEAAGESTVTLANRLVDKLQISPGQAFLKVRLGHVEVGGEPWAHEQIPLELLPHVMVDGEPLPD